MLDPLPALAAALIWAYASVSYGDWVKALGVARLNTLRVVYTSIALLAPALLLGLNRAALYAALSGVLSLALGDSLYLKSIKTAGVSIAAPASYSYILMEQFVAVALGEPLRPTYLVSSLIIVAGIYVLSRGEGEGRLLGVLYALGAAASWAGGYAAIKVAGAGGLNPISTAFVRALTALAALSWSARGLGVGEAMRRTWRTPLPIIAVLDLGVGAALFAYSAVAIGVSLTVIITGVEPLAAQIMARAMGKERPGLREYVAAVLILTAIIISLI
ncbi:MAG: EamA family transporter [Thermoproteus sp. AZ2]|uniref:EamA family transporter n=1 Tax=Thermoproteus sp. AZ2 TaxID=1609232 RepID=A0ACC6V1Y4_9CREN